MAALPWARATAFRGHLPSGFRCATALLSSTALGPSYWDAPASVWSASRCPPLTRPSCRTRGPRPRPPALTDPCSSPSRDERDRKPWAQVRERVLTRTGPGRPHVERDPVPVPWKVLSCQGWGHRHESRSHLRQVSLSIVRQMELSRAPWPAVPGARLARDG